MSKLDKLLEIIEGIVQGFKLPENVEIKDNKVEVELAFLKKEQTIHIEGNVILINADTSEGRLIAEKIFANTGKLLDKNERVVEKDFGHLIEAATPYADESEDDKKFLELVRVFTPKSDIPIIKEALFIRRLYKNSTGVEVYKTMLIQRHGARGNNIANLISAGYFENYLAPLHAFLVKTEGELAQEIFGAIYEEAVTQFPFAVFVSTAKSYEHVKQEVVQKIKFNLLNNQNVLNIHGIGVKNKKTIVKLLSDLDITRSYLAEPDIVELSKTVYARIYF